MNFNRTILTMAVLSCITLSCSNDPVADDVYKMNKPVEEKLTYGLSVTLDGTKETGEYYLAASTNSLFNSRGEADNFTKDAFLFTIPFKDGKAVIADLKAYRNEVLFFNVLKKDGEDFQLSTNTGSELKYHPVFGLQQKIIDLSASPEAFVKQTLVQIEIPKAYLGKALFLIPSEDTEQFETDAKNGQQLNGDNYLKIESNTTQIPYYMVTPIKDIKYSLYPLVELN